MLSVIARAQRCSQSALTRFYGETVIYAGEGATVQITAVARRPANQVDPATETVPVRHNDLDWQFPAEALTLNGQIATPQPGHRITAVERQRNGVEVYEVVPDGEEDCFQRCGPMGEFVRVHTKRIQAS